MFGVLDTPKKAVPVGTLFGVQLAAALKLKVPGTGPGTVAGLFQVASCAAAGKAAASRAEDASSAARRRGRPAAAAATRLARERDGCARIESVPAREGSGETALVRVSLPPPRDFATSTLCAQTAAGNSRLQVPRDCRRLWHWRHAGVARVALRCSRSPDQPTGPRKARPDDRLREIRDTSARATAPDFGARKPRLIRATSSPARCRCRRKWTSRRRTRRRTWRRA